jgi:hypothetical protein
MLVCGDFKKVDDAQMLFLAIKFNPEGQLHIVIYFYKNNFKLLL